MGDNEDVEENKSSSLLLDDSIRDDANSEGYGIEGEFVPEAVFDMIEQAEPTEDSVFSYVPDGSEEGLDELSVEGESEEIHEEKLGESIGEEGGEDGGVEEEAGGYIEQEQEEEEEEGAEEGTEKEGAEEEEEKSRAEVRFDGPKESEEEPKETHKGIYRKRMSVRNRPIYTREGESHRISGDFTAHEDFLESLNRRALSIQSFQSEKESIISEEIEEEEFQPIDREEYYMVYRELSGQHDFELMKNNFLQKKMSDYYKKRKMEHVLKETDNVVDSQSKYYRKLDQYADLKDLEERDRANISWDLEDLTSSRHEQLEVLERHFTAMQEREKEIGTGLIDSKTGKEIPGKLVDRFIKRQLNKSNEVATMRLFNIKLRNRIAEKKVALRAMDCIGENLNLIDYEQLKVANQSHVDKIEERDVDLMKLRLECKTAIQCLAHIREKSAALHVDIAKEGERYDEVEMEYMDCRERLNYYKQMRDSYRFEIERLKKEAGLLCTPKLCLDRDVTMKDLKLVTEEYEQLKVDTSEVRDGLKAMKRNYSEILANRKPRKKTKPVGKSASQRIYKGRPTLSYPQLPESEWSFSFKHDDV